MKHKKVEIISIVFASKLPRESGQLRINTLTS